MCSWLIAMADIDMVGIVLVAISLVLDLHHRQDKWSAVPCPLSMDGHQYHWWHAHQNVDDVEKKRWGCVPTKNFCHRNFHDFFFILGDLIISLNCVSVWFIIFFGNFDKNWDCERPLPALSPGWGKIPPFSSDHNWGLPVPLIKIWKLNRSPMYF